MLDWCLEGNKERGRARSVRELRARISEALKDRYMPRSMAPDAQATQVYLDVVYASEPPSSSWPQRQLDTSLAGGPVPPEIEDLPEEPLPDDARVNIARAALEALPIEQRIAVLTECAAHLGYRLEKLRTH